MQKIPIEPKTWQELDIDNYLAKYPDGKSLTVLGYTLNQHVENFVCGIGETCSAGQPCNPIPGPTWQILYAVQNWNMVQNTLYDIVATAMSMAQSTTAAMVADLYHPSKRSPLWKWNEVFAIAGGIAALIASVVIIWPGTLLAMGIWYFISAVIATGDGVVGMEIMNYVKKDNPDPFQRWSEYSWYLGKWQTAAQGALNNMTDSVLASGISTPEGISGVLKNGSYFKHLEAKKFSDVQSEMSFAAAARVLTAIIQDYGGFVTVGEGCNDKGPNGAWADPDSISYCYPNKTMMNVIRQKKGKSVNTWYHGSLIKTSYNFTAEYITTQSWNCHILTNNSQLNPYNVTGVPTDRNQPCVINLPVCDTRIPAVHHAIKKHGTVKACREVAKLPI
ncbi:hypothetical protein BY996DRAFT_4576863 [Phakopsora pachyrhizi]|uniref:DUF7872 domain-containing protein n=1 Tax=Phakopsora pachyrhizi TaxID=170000 RepID=A0AAV0BQ77_PHAPC|nr:hypothetical protein BY996DRAFT_4576863 [Phakopsora pachyrhizi]CAH7689524.1 hypothetical protein PPACK8108_LOCUS24607 [Phakopsora pachyrhizi]